MLIALADAYDFKIYKMDVKTTFFNEELKQEIYMEQPEGFVVHVIEEKVYRLEYSLYGLKKAPK